MSERQGSNEPAANPQLPAPACCDSVLLSECCGEEVKPACCGPVQAPVVCGCNDGPAGPRTRADARA